MAIDTGGEAFPTHPNERISGLTKRDWFAGQAAIALIGIFPVQDTGLQAIKVARRAYEIADAMLVERERD